MEMSEVVFGGVIYANICGLLSWRVWMTGQWLMKYTHNDLMLFEDAYENYQLSHIHLVHVHVIFWRSL